MSVAMSDDMVGGYFKKIAQWGIDRGLDGSNTPAQFGKLVEEVTELATNMVQKKCMKDDIGDIMVVLTMICLVNDYTIEQCLEQAWGDIKDRKGRLVDGVFVKETV